MELVNTITEKFHHLPGMCQHITYSYHPQTNGLVGFQNRTMEDDIKKYVDKSQK